MAADMLLVSLWAACASIGASLTAYQPVAKVIRAAREQKAESPRRRNSLVSQGILLRRGSPIFWASFALLLALAFRSTFATGCSDPVPQRVVIRGAVVASDSGSRTGMSIVVESGVVVAIVPDGDPAAGLRPGDIPFDARGDVVAPGLIEWRATEAPTYAELARAPFSGVLAVVASSDAEAIAWRRRVGETASFRAAELLPAPTGDPEAIASLARLQALPRPGPSATREERSAWLRARTVAMAEIAGAPRRGLVEVGHRGDFVFLEVDPRDDLSVYDRPRQALIQGRPSRQAELETNRAFVDDAARWIAQVPAPPDSRISFAIESSGLLVGGLDAAPSGDAAREFWGPPVSSGHDWRLARRGSEWSHEGLITIGERTRLRIEATGASGSVRVRGWLEEGDREVSETTIEASAEEPFFDPVTLASRRRDRLIRLAPGETDAFDVVEILPVDQSLRIGVRRLEWRRAETGPAGGLALGERAFRLGTPGRELTGSEVGWVVLDASGHPRWGALIADAGITEYHRRPQPSAESMP